MRYHVTPVRMVAIKRLQITNAGEDVEEMVPSYTLRGNLAGVYNSQYMESTYMSIYIRMDKQDMVHIHNGILLSH